MARIGAEVTGVDLSANLVQRAEALDRAQPLGIRYLVGDVSQTTLPQPVPVSTNLWLTPYPFLIKHRSTFMQNLRRALNNFYPHALSDSHPTLTRLQPDSHPWEFRPSSMTVPLHQQRVLYATMRIFRGYLDPRA